MPGHELPNSLLNMLEHDTTVGSPLVSISTIALCLPEVFSTSKRAHMVVPCHEHGQGQQSTRTRTMWYDVDEEC